MALWGNLNSANSAPKFVTNSGTGETGIQEYGDEVIFVNGNEGYPVPPGWARKFTKGGRTLWESLVPFSSSIPQNALVLNGQAITLDGQFIKI